MSIENEPDPLTQIAWEIAEFEGVDPTELEVQIGEYVDVDALEALLRLEITSWCFEFSVAEYRVTVEGSGAVSVVPARLAA